MINRSVLIFVIVGGVFLVACSDDPLSDVGHVTNGWIGEKAAGELGATPATQPAPVFHSSSEVAWANDHLDLSSDSSEETLSVVWQRREPGSTYVQATRSEIAGVLPGVGFPDLLPEDIEFVSSQLLFDGDGTLAGEYVAVFGLWTAEPYTLSRTVGQQGILWVALPDADHSGCDRFADRNISSCDTLLFSGQTGWELTSGNDETLVWIDGDYQYELFHRSQVDAETAQEMATAMIPLADVQVLSRDTFEPSNTEPVAADE